MQVMPNSWKWLNWNSYINSLGQKSSWKMIFILDLENNFYHKFWTTFDKMCHIFVHPVSGFQTYSKTRLKRIESKIAREAASKTQNTSNDSSKCLDMFWYFYENTRTTMKMQGRKWKCKDKKENARTTQKAIPWIALSKSSDQKQTYFEPLPLILST